MWIIATIIIYFFVLYAFSRLAQRESDNESFFRAGRRSPWYMVAFGMVGASISGVTFVSVPGMVLTQDMTYLQMCLGFIVGYFLVAFVLLPVYYRQRLTTIYAYLLQRLGRRSYKTAAWFFLLSKLLGSSVKFYLVCLLLQRFVCDAVGVPMVVTVALLVGFIWFYTRRGGIRTLVFTDVLQTSCMLVALFLIIYGVVDRLDMSAGQAVRAVVADSHSRVFEMGDWLSRQHFCKQFVSGIFIVAVMTGLDQDMMQKNLTCKTLRDAQKDMCSYGFAFVPVNLLFLSLGVLLLFLAQRQGLPLPAHGDDLLPLFAATGRLGIGVTVLFTLGVVAASFSTADSSLTSLTTSCCVDLFQRPDDVTLRHRVHLGMSFLLALCVLLVHAFRSDSLLDAIYTLVSYTYGPLLGMFAFALFTKRQAGDRWVPYIAVASPVISYLTDDATAFFLHYHFGYELLLLNGLLTFAGLWLTSSRRYSVCK